MFAESREPGMFSGWPFSVRTKPLHEWQRAQENGVDEAEDGRVRPDAQREREHGHGGEAGGFQQLAEGEFKIVHGSLSVVSCQ